MSGPAQRGTRLGGGVGGPRRPGPTTGAQPAARCTKTHKCDSPARASGNNGLEGRGTYLGVEVADQQDGVSCPCQAWDGDPARRCRCRRRRRDGQRSQGPVHVRNREAWRGKGGQDMSGSARDSAEASTGPARPHAEGKHRRWPRSAWCPPCDCRLLLPLLTAQTVLGLDPSTCATQYGSSARWMRNRAPGGPQACVHAGARHHADDTRGGTQQAPACQVGRPAPWEGRSGVPPHPGSCHSAYQAT